MTTTSLDAPQATENGGVLSGPYRALTVGIVSVLLMLYFEIQAVTTAMPVAARQLHGLGLYAFAFSGVSTAELFAQVVSGQWCDRRGPLPALFTGVGLFGTGLLLDGTALNMWVFLGGRLIQGLGGGLAIVALYVVVGRAFPERLHPAIFAVFAATGVLPALIGPAISGTVAQHLGWRWVFLGICALIVPPLLLMGPALRRSERAHKPPTAKPFDRRPIALAALAAFGAALLQYAGTRLDPVALLAGAVGAALLLPAVLRLLPPGTLRARQGLPTVILLRGVAIGAFAGAEAFVPLMLVTQRGLSPTLAGLTLTSGGLSYALGSWLQKRPSADQHRTTLIGLGLVLLAAAIASTALVLIAAVPVWTAIAVWAVGGIGMGLAIPSISVLTMKLSKPENTGANSAALHVSDALGNILIIGLAGTLFSALSAGSTAGVNAGPFAVVFLVMAGVAVLGAVLSRRTDAQR